MKKIKLFPPMALLFLLTAAIGNAQSSKIEFNEFDLDNGLHVILHQNNSTPTVAI